MEISTLADIKLAGRAINEDWPVNQELRSEIVETLTEIVRSGVPDFQLAASKVLLAADALNAKKREIERKRLEAEHARKLQLIEAAVKLGIVGNAGGSAGAIPGQSSSSFGQ